MDGKDSGKGGGAERRTEREEAGKSDELALGLYHVVRLDDAPLFASEVASSTSEHLRVSFVVGAPPVNLFFRLFPGAAVFFGAIRFESVFFAMGSFPALLFDGVLAAARSPPALRPATRP